MWSWSYPFQGWFVINSLVLSMINLPTKFELSNYTHYKDRKGDTKYVQLCRPSSRRAKTYPGCGLGFPAITSTLATHWFFPDGTIYQTRLMLYGFHYGPASIKWCVYGSLKIASRDTDRPWQGHRIYCARIIARIVTSDMFNSSFDFL